MRIPKKFAPSVSRWHDKIFCTPGKVARQANRGSKIPSDDRPISVAIAHYNRGRLAYRPLCYLLNNSFVDEVVFFDDGSSVEELSLLRNFVEGLGLPGKIRIEFRRENLGAQATKLDAVAACRNEWVLILDSDNTAFRSYLSRLGSLVNCDPNTIYCSPFAFPYFSFRPFAGRVLSFEECCALTRGGELRRVFIINDGNYLVHRETYLQRIGPLTGMGSDVADVMVANYKWLSDGGRLQVLNRGAYHHRIDASSFWMRTADESRERVLKIFRLFEQGIPWQSGGKEQIYGTIV